MQHSLALIREEKHTVTMVCACGWETAARSATAEKSAAAEAETEFLAHVESQGGGQ